MFVQNANNLTAHTAEQMNLVPGQVVEVVLKVPFDGPLTVRTDGATHAIAHNVAACLKVKPVEE